MSRKTVRSRLRKRRGPTREIAHGMRVDKISVPYRYSTRAFLKALANSGQLAAELKLRLLLRRLGMRNCVAEYAAEIFATTGYIPLEADLRYDTIARWADAKNRVIVVKQKRVKQTRKLSSEKKAWHETGNKFRKDVDKTLARGRRKGKIEVKLNKLLRS